MFRHGFSSSEVTSEFGRTKQRRPGEYFLGAP